MRVVFMGTPTFAVATLDALYNRGHEVAMVLTQPDRPVGRGRKLTPPPVKTRAVELGVKVFQPRRVKETESIGRVVQVNPDVIVVVGYGQIIPMEIYTYPELGCLNVHASLLPHYRGAAPINWAIARGESVTGITTMKISKRLDAGSILLKRDTPIGPLERASELSARLAVMGSKLLLETLDGLATSTVVSKPQKEEDATYAPILKRQDGLIDWSTSAVNVFNRLRGFDPWPGSFTSFRGMKLNIRWALPVASSTEKPGEIRAFDEGFVVGCGGGSALAVETVQPANRNCIGADEFVRGYHPVSGEKLGE